MNLGTIKYGSNFYKPCARDKSTASYTVTGLAAETTHYFKVRLYDTGGLSRDSNIVSGKIVVVPSLPWIPIGVGLITILTAVLILFVRKRGKTS